MFARIVGGRSWVRYIKKKDLKKLMMNENNLEIEHRK